jgi:hypothetical protein
MRLGGDCVVDFDGDCEEAGAGPRLGEAAGVVVLAFGLEDEAGIEVGAGCSESDL